jgi:hypothetical protein
MKYHRNEERIINDDLEEVGKIMALIRIFKGYPA